MQWTVGRKIGISFAFGLLILVVIGTVAYRNTRKLMTATDARQFAADIVDRINELSGSLKDAESAQRGYLLTGKETHLAAFNAATNRIAAVQEELRGLNIDTPELAKLLSETRPLISARIAEWHDSISRRDPQKPAAEQSLPEPARSGTDELKRVLRELLIAEQSILKLRAAEVFDHAENTFLIIRWGTAAAFCLLFLISLLLARNIGQPLREITDLAGKIAQGDLRNDRKPSTRTDEIGQLDRAFARMSSALYSIARETEKVASGNLTVQLKPQSEHDLMGQSVATMIGRLSQLISQVQMSGIQVNTSATQIAATAREQQATASEVASTTTEIGATAREISATSKELVKTITEVTRVAEETASLAGTGQSGIHRMSTTMQQIMDASGAVSTKLSVVNEKTGNINQVVTTITKVADQTNLLSLNAAIEAEKAGEYGRGFAVVATEIRRLADQTAVSSYEIEQMVKEMQSAVSAGVMGMDKFSEEVRRGVEEVRHVSDSLGQIIHQVQALSPQFESVDEGMKAQSTAAAQISEALAQLSDAAQQTAESLRQSNLAIDQLNEAARGLQSGVSRFKV